MKEVRGNDVPRVRTSGAFGEMVDLLWRDGNAKAALRLEELWNDAGKDLSPLDPLRLPDGKLLQGGGSVGVPGGLPGT